MRLAIPFLWLCYLLVPDARAQEGVWDWHPTRPVPPGEKDEIFRDLSESRREAVALALARLWLMLEGCLDGHQDELEITFEVYELEDALRRGDIVTKLAESKPLLTTGGDSTNGQGDMIFTPEGGNVISIGGWLSGGVGVSTWGSGRSLESNDMILAACLVGELQHQDLRSRVNANNAPIADPVGTPDARTREQNKAAFRQSEREAAQRAIDILNLFIMCPPPLSPRELQDLQKAIVSLTNFMKEFK